jgi:YVTN family beta-propeller protein
MIRMVEERFPSRMGGLAIALVLSGVLGYSQSNPQGQANSGAQSVPNMGQQITPLAPQGSQFGPLNLDLLGNPSWRVGHAVTTVVSPDRKTLLVLTSGYNRYFNANTNLYGFYGPLSLEYVFVYDISTPTPVKKQIVPIVPNTYNGIVFDPSGKAFYAAGGPSDNVHIFALNAATGTWAEAQGSPLALGHRGGLGIGVLPCAAGLAISNDGQTLVAVNYYNDSISVFTGGLGNWSKPTELDLRPGKSSTNPQSGVPGGEYPFWAVVKGNGPGATAYVSSVRDREIDVVSLGGTPVVTARIALKGQPNKMTMNAAQSLLYVASDQSDTVDVIDTVKNAVLESIPVIGSAIPASLAQHDYKGANPNSVTLSPDERQLYVTNGNLNCIAVVALSGSNSGDQVVGLIPTGWYPNSVSFSGDGNTVYAINGKSPTGPNGEFCYGGYGPPGEPNCMASNEYNPQLIKAGFQIFPRPGAEQLATLTQQVASNDHFMNTESAGDAAVMAAVRQGVKHVVFILRENRTYDQILGDLEIGNGDPNLATFGQTVTPNAHALARNFVTLDNFMCTAEVSYDGWLWSTAAQAPDVVERQWPIAYGVRGTSLDSEGLNRNVNVAIPTAGRPAANSANPSDPDLLPGLADTAAPDGPNNEVNTGYLWNSALRAGLTVRNYGFFVDITRYAAAPLIPVVRNPASTGTVVAYPSNVALAPYTDPYFRGFDNILPDFYRYSEWAREFDGMARRARPDVGGPALPPSFPSLSLVRFMHDHTGNFDVAIDGVNTPELMVADNDYAVGLLVQKISESKYANDTLIFVIEDDAQDGGDHVDSHRSIAFVAGAYVKQGALVSTQYNTINFLRTMEEVLGLPPMNLNDALAAPMADIFNTTPSPWSFTAVPSPLLYYTQLPIAPPKRAELMVPKPAHDGRYWAKVTRGMDFTDADRVDDDDFNHVLWKGIMGKRPYPAKPTGLDLRQNRAELLARYQQSLKKTAQKPKKDKQ